VNNDLTGKSQRIERMKWIEQGRTLVTFLALAVLVVALMLALRPAAAPYLDLVRRGDEHAARAERTAAVVAYREAASLRPDDPFPYLRLAQVYLDWGRVEDALDAIAQGQQLGAEGVALERLWVAAYVARADWSAVVEHGQRLLTLASGEEMNATRHTLAQAYSELREWDAARTEYETLLRDDPTDSLAQERLGVLLLGDDDAAAVQHLFAAGTDLAHRLFVVIQEPGVADSPAYASALLGRVLLREQEWALAARQFERAIADSPGYADAHAYLGYTLDQMGRPDEARPHLLQAIELAPDSAAAHIFLGLHYDRQGNVAAARVEYEAAYDLDPDNPATCVEIGQTWAAERRYIAAEIWLREAIALQPEDPDLWRILTRFYLDHNITSDGQGVEAATELVELSPGDARAHDLRGWAALQVGDYDTAQDSLLRAASLDPTLASAHYHLGLLWTALDTYQEARDAFTHALDLDTTGELAPLVERAIGEIP
jgi:tetratricopeptide (TPR) repeat protein